MPCQIRKRYSGGVPPSQLPSQLPPYMAATRTSHRMSATHSVATTLPCNSASSHAPPCNAFSEHDVDHVSLA